MFGKKIEILTKNQNFDRNLKKKYRFRKKKLKSTINYSLFPSQLQNLANIYLRYMEI